jgi:exonuclease VII small subunit
MDPQTDDLEQAAVRLEAALERIARAGAAAQAAPQPVAGEAAAQAQAAAERARAERAEVVARLDSLIAKLRAALASAAA